jgi:hypothetical protein
MSVSGDVSQDPTATPGFHAIGRPGRRSFERSAAVSCLLLALAARPAGAECGRIDDPLQVLDLYLEIDPADWDAVRHDANFDDDGHANTERPAEFRCGDEAPLPVLVRRKRLLALPSDQDPRKVSLKIDFDDRVPEGEWHGHRKLSLENGQGGSLLAEGIAWQLMRRAGVICGAAAWVRLHVNGAPAGIFLRVEQIDKSYLRRHLDEDEGFLYKGTRRETREGEEDPFAAALCFPPFGTGCPAPAGHEGLGARVDLRQLFTMAAADAFAGNWDSLFGLGNNYFWYSSARPRLYFPWDLDAAFSRDPRTDPDLDPHNILPGLPGFKSLFQVAALREEFDRILLRLAGDAFHPDAVDRLLDEVAAAVGPAIAADPLNGLPGGLDAEVARIRSFVRARAAALPRFLPAPAPHPLVINEVVASNRSGAVDEGGDHADWVEVHNRGDRPVALAGLSLSDDPAEPFKWPFPEGMLEPGEYLIIWCDHDVGQGPLHTGFQLEAEGECVGLYEGDGDIQRAIDFVRFGPQAADVSIGRSPDGAPGLRALDCATPGEANCGPFTPRFARGDADLDGALDLTDAVRILGALFLGEGAACEDAADADDDGALGAADAVSLLTHLFLGGAPPPPPHPGCHRDPTPDGLGCGEAGACPG